MKLRTTLCGLLAGALAVVGCATAEESDENSGGSAVVESSQSESDFVVIDRMGRPEISNLTVGLGGKAIDWETGKPTANPARSVTIRYNTENTFHLSEAGAKVARKALDEGIVNLDNQDWKKDWSDTDRKRFVDILIEDALVVDIAKPCDVTSANPTFFEIEKAQLSGTSYTSCGGRVPNDDIIDDQLGLLIKKNFDFKNNPIKDEVGPDHRTIKATFPYLDEPHRDALN